VKRPSAVWFQPQGFGHGLAFEASRGARFLPLGAAVSPERRTVPLVVEVANPGGELRIGASGRAQVGYGDGRETLAIPASALQEEDGAPVVYVQAEGERFERRVVRLGVRQGDRVEVLQGLEAGEHVVTLGSHLVRLAGSSGKVPEHGHAH
jgi:multidrug efflux pump subunit AcrA (membrane-fusion protein)